MIAIDKLTAALVRTGSGPITTVPRVVVSSKLDAAGQVTLSMPASDPRGALLQPDQLNYVRAVVSGETADLSRIGIIRERTTSPSTLDLRLRGPNLLDELSYSNVGMLTLESTPGSGLPMPKADILDAILDGTGWTFTGEPSRDVYHKFGRETTLAALLKLADLTGDHVRLSHTVARQVDWLAAGEDGFVPVPSGLIAKEAFDPSDDACLIVHGSFQFVEDGTERITRLYAAGAGNADAQLWINATTLGIGNPGDGTPGDYAYGDYTIHIDADPAMSYIAHTASDAGTPIGDVETISDVAPLSQTATDEASAADELVMRAIVILRRRLVDQRALRFTLLHADLTRLIEGSSLRVRARQYVSGYGVLDIDEDVLLLSVTPTFAEGDPQVAVEVTNLASDRQPNGGGAPVQLTAGALQQLVGAVTTIQEQQRHVQTAERLRGVDTTTAASPGQALAWNPTTGRYEPTTMPGGGASVSDTQLIEWTAGEDFELTAVTYDGTYTSVISTATVKWPDGSAGTFTTTTINTTWEAIDAFTITHTDSGKTVTQSAVTRNADGHITTKPALTVSP
jgi:hypothetical protein